MRCSDPLVMEILPADQRSLLIADGQPDLRLNSPFKVVGGLGAAHLGRNPARIDRVRQHVWQPACDTERERNNE